MKLRDEFLTHTAGGESLLVPTGKATFSGLVKGNRTFGEIVELLKAETTEEQMIAALKARYDAPQEKIAQDVKTVVEGLRQIGALDE